MKNSTKLIATTYLAIGAVTSEYTKRRVKEDRGVNTEPAVQTSIALTWPLVYITYFAGRFSPNKKTPIALENVHRTHHMMSHPEIAEHCTNCLYCVCHYPATLAAPCSPDMVTKSPHV